MWFALEETILLEETCVLYTLTSQNLMLEKKTEKNTHSELLPSKCDGQSDLRNESKAEDTCSWDGNTQIPLACNLHPLDCVQPWKSQITNWSRTHYKYDTGCSSGKVWGGRSLKESWISSLRCRRGHARGSCSYLPPEQT
jgi:hypothetical protein